MADETVPATSEVTETGSPSAPAADAASGVSPSTDTPAPENQDGAESAAEDAWFAKEGDSAPATPPVQGEQATETQPAGDNAAQGQQATTPGDLDPDSLTVLKRAGVEPEEFAKWSDGARLRFVAKQSKIQSDYDRAFSNRQQPASPQGQQPPAAQGQPNAQQTPAPVADDPLKRLEDEYGVDYVAPLRQKFAEQESRFQNVHQVNEQITARLVRDDFEAGLKEAGLPASIDTASPEVRQAILKQAIALAQVDGFTTPAQVAANGYLRHAIPKAAASLFSNEILAATKQAKTEQNATRLRGQVTRTSVIPKSKTDAPSSEEEREAAYFKDHPELLTM